MVAGRTVFDGLAPVATRLSRCAAVHAFLPRSRKTYVGQLGQRPRLLQVGPLAHNDSLIAKRRELAIRELNSRTRLGANNRSRRLQLRRQRALAARHARHAWIVFHGHPQRAGRGFEDCFADVVAVAAVVQDHVQVAQRVGGRRLPEIFD